MQPAEAQEPVVPTTWVCASAIAFVLLSWFAVAQPTTGAPVFATSEGTYVGSSACAGCHAVETTAWRTSQHARAMQEATDGTVLGDFSGVSVEHHGSRARFFREGDRFVAETDGKDGKPAAFTVKYTFGLEPLQQYLVAFPDGRVQALPFAWDTRSKEAGGQRWFHLHPEGPVPHTDPLHWTGLDQNWNYMCAECHSTNVRKNYDPAANTFRTTFAEISVGCESCHGPASGHLAWAQRGRPADVQNSGFSSIVTKRAAVTWAPDAKTGSPAVSAAQPGGGEVEMCGRCHARRGQFSEDWRPGRPLADTHLPALLTADLFEADGQMREEVFNHASFLQSRMYAKGVICSDCHDPHAGTLKAARAEVCSQCHAPATFATAAHSGHPAGPAAPDCISCHMPQRTYMVVDPRHDHSFRIPRPDLSMALGTPNACNDCHGDKPARWAADAVGRWHGPQRKGFQTYATAFQAARQGRPEARDLLLRVARDPGTPAIARATALLELRTRPSAETDALRTTALADPDPMVRIAALRGLEALPPDQRWSRGSPLLSDPVRSVRREAAVALANVPDALVPAGQRAARERAEAEYVEGERFNADRPESRLNLGNFHLRKGRMTEAETEYLEAIRLASASVPARVNLADLYRVQGRDQAAEQLLRMTIQMAPGAAAPQHALGLTLVRLKRLAEALGPLRRAADLEPSNGRYAFVLGVALQGAGSMDEARAVLERAHAAHPSEAEILSALLQDALRRRDPDKALIYGERLGVLRPDNAELRQLVRQLRGRSDPGQPARP